MAEQSMDLPAAQEAVDPTFASMFPAASIIPHTVAIDDEAWHIATALRFFSALQFTGAAGVRRQRHYELYEQPRSIESYARLLDGLAEYDGGTAAVGVPRRSGCNRVWGWSFDCLFAEMPRYRVWLRDLFAELGGSVETGASLHADDLATLDESVVVNCTGFGAGRCCLARQASLCS